MPTDPAAFSPSERVAPQARSVVLRVEGLTVIRPPSPLRFELPVLELKAGDAAALLGPSGSGKTTVLRALLGLEPGVVRTGRVEVAGRPVGVPGSEGWRGLLHGPVVVVPQDARAALDPLQPLRVQILQAAPATDAELYAALAALGIDSPAEFAARYPHQVSGGQAQRACLALALLRRPALVLADEPTASLDAPNALEFVRAVALLRERSHSAVLVATHDLQLVQGLRAAVWVSAGGRFQPGRVELPPWPRRPRSEAGSVALACRGLGVKVDRRWLVRGIDLELHHGATLALVGPSGAGKTTVAKALAGHLRLTEGSLEGAAKPTRRGPRRVQMLFQDAYGSLTPHRTAAALIRETAHAGFEVAAEAQRLGLAPELLVRTPDRLSGGERRRVALLRALGAKPAGLILDEPTAALDRQAANAVMAAVIAAQRTSDAAVLLITHDRELADAVADRVVSIEAGRLVR